MIRFTVYELLNSVHVCAATNWKKSKKIPECMKTTPDLFSTEHCKLLYLLEVNNFLEFCLFCLQLVDDLNCKLVFLNKRFDQASHTDWKGMFRKPPLW